jgi:hypothetical protein
MFSSIKSSCSDLFPWIHSYLTPKFLELDTLLTISMLKTEFLISLCSSQPGPYNNPHYLDFWSKILESTLANFYCTIVSKICWLHFQKAFRNSPLLPFLTWFTLLNCSLGLYRWFSTQHSTPDVLWLNQILLNSFWWTPQCLMKFPLLNLITSVIYYYFPLAHSAPATLTSLF